MGRAPKPKPIEDMDLDAEEPLPIEDEETVIAKLKRVIESRDRTIAALYLELAQLEEQIASTGTEQTNGQAA